MPGPVAGYPWTVENIDYALESVPREKLSMGIPLYGCRWFAGDSGKQEKPNPTAEYIGREQVEQYRAAYHPQLEWDAYDRIARSISTAMICATAFFTPRNEDFSND